MDQRKRTEQPVPTPPSAALSGCLTRRAILQRAAVLGVAGSALDLFGGAGGGLAASGRGAALSPAWLMAAQAAPTNYQTWNRAEYQRETGRTIAQYAEAPALAARVAEGTLPPVAERLPAEPLVVQPIETVGKYCETLTGYGVNPTSFGNDVYSARQQHLIAIYPDNETLAPQIAESFALADDGMSFTVTLRAGMSWSDGAPFTADDIMFWYQDILLNEELTPAIATALRPGGEVIRVTKTADDTVTFQTSVPFPAIVEYLVTALPFAPKHYLSRWHLKYNPDAETVAKNEGFETWVQGFLAHATTGDDQTDVALPSIDPWFLARADQFGNRYYDRNPYYWKVDTAGNQLPYANTEVRLLTGNVETTILRIRNGEIDFGAEQLQLKDYPVLKENEEAGNYRALLWEGITGADRRYLVNLTVQDPVLNQVFNDLRFRQALSLAINRDEINETLFFGRATPRQYTAPPTTSFFEAALADSFAAFDPDRANALLDELGLARGGDGQPRLRPDGEPLRFTIEDATTNEKMDELIRDYWGAIGIEVTIKSETRELYAQRAQANETQASVWFGEADEFGMHVNAYNFRPPWGIDNVPHSGAPWNTWRITGGEEGQEPPPELQELIALAERFQQATTGTEEYAALGKDLLTRNVDGLFSIGTVGLAPAVVVAKKNLRNFPEQGTMMMKFVPVHGDQWFVE